MRRFDMQSELDPKNGYGKLTGLTTENTGVADDVLGEVIGSGYGNAFRWSYSMEIPVGNTLYEVGFQDWFWAIDDRRLFNRSYIQKFGFDMAEVTIFMERQ